MYRTSYSEMVFYFLNYVIKRKDILLLQEKNTAELFSSSFAQVREDDKFAFLSASLPCFVRWCMMNEKGAFCLEITNSYQISLCLFRGASRSKQNWLSESFFQNNSLITFWPQDTVLHILQHSCYSRCERSFWRLSPCQNTYRKGRLETFPPRNFAGCSEITRWLH